MGFRWSRDERCALEDSAPHNDARTARSAALSQLAFGAQPVFFGLAFGASFLFPKSTRASRDLVLRRPNRIRPAPRHTHSGRVAATARVLRESVVDRFFGGHGGIGRMPAAGDSVTTIFRREEKAWPSRENSLSHVGRSQMEFPADGKTSLEIGRERVSFHFSFAAG